MLSRTAFRVAVFALVVALAMPYLAHFNSFTPIKGAHALLTAYYQRVGIPAGRNISAEQAALETILSAPFARTDTDEHFLSDARRATSPSFPIQFQPPQLPGMEITEVRLPSGKGAPAYWFLDEKVKNASRLNKPCVTPLIMLTRSHATHTCTSWSTASPRLPL